MRKRYKNRTGIGVISVVVLIICGIVSYRGVGLMQQKTEDKIKIERLNSKIQEQQDRSADINNFKKYAQTKQYVEDIAREKLGLVDKDDVIIKQEK